MRTRITNLGQGLLLLCCFGLLYSSAFARDPVQQHLDPGNHQATYQTTLQLFHSRGALARLWKKDSSLWITDAEVQSKIVDRLGWIDLPEWFSENAATLQTFGNELRNEGFEQVFHLGMGGSSLAAKTLANTIGLSAGGLAYQVLDSISPAMILSMDPQLDQKRTLVVVSSQSGTTVETRSLYSHFFELFKHRESGSAGKHFIAITKKDSPLADIAHQRQFRKIFYSHDDVGGRFSALSYVGALSAALMRTNVTLMAQHALQTKRNLEREVNPFQNQAAQLAAFLAGVAKNGANKLTLLTSNRLRPFGEWVEQMMAESLGKEGRGLIPIVDEPMGPIEGYGKDRVFVVLRYADDAPDEIEDFARAASAKGLPVARITLDSPEAIMAEFFRWEVATALAGVALSVNPFDEPNVAESKRNTKAALASLERTGLLPLPRARLETEELIVYASDELWQQIQSDSMADTLRQFFGLLRPRNYLALLAYLTPTETNQTDLRETQGYLQETLRMPVLRSFGPGHLHSIGQAYKGGPPEGAFLQITTASAQDVSVPGQFYTFDQLQIAQALGDYEALGRRRRPILWLHLKNGDSSAGSVVVKEIRGAVESLR